VSLAEIVAGPLFTLRVTGSPLLALGALTLNGDAQSAFGGMALNAEMIWEALVTIKLVVTSGAAL
jgi:hypothetical protein